MKELQPLIIELGKTVEWYFVWNVLKAFHKNVNEEPCIELYYFLQYIFFVLSSWIQKNSFDKLCRRLHFHEQTYYLLSSILYIQRSTRTSHRTETTITTRQTRLSTQKTLVPIVLELGLVSSRPAGINASRTTIQTTLSRPQTPIYILFPLTNRTKLISFSDTTNRKLLRIAPCRFAERSALSGG